MILSRRDFLRSGVAAGAAATLGESPWVEVLRARGIPLKIGVTDWNLGQTGKPIAVELSKRIGFDGVEISLGRRATDRLPLADEEIQRQYLEESRKHNLSHRQHLFGCPAPELPQKRSAWATLGC